MKQKKNTQFGKQKPKNKSQKSQSIQITSHTDEMGNLFKIILILVVLFALFYVVTYYVTKNKETEASGINSNPEKAVIQYDEIMIGTLLKQAPSHYYVLIKEKDDPFNETYEKYLESYKNSGKENVLRVYTADLSHGLNQQYRGEENHLNVSSISELRLKETTLVKVGDGQLSETYVGSSDILNHLKSITK